MYSPVILKELSSSSSAQGGCSQEGQLPSSAQAHVPSLHSMRKGRCAKLCIIPWVQFPQQYSALRLELATSHLQMLKEITGVRGSTSTDILLAELGLKSLQHVWLLRAAKFWNSLAGKPSGTFYKVIALDCCRDAVGSSRHNWAWSMFKAIRATGYELSIRVDDMDTIDITGFEAARCPAAG